MLRYIGCQVLVASDGAAAVTLAVGHEGKIDLLLADVIMPGMNGVQLRTELLKLRPDLKVLFISGYAGDVISTLGAFDAGTSLLQKPFTLKTLSVTVRRSLDVPSPRSGRTDATADLRELAASVG